MFQVTVQVQLSRLVTVLSQAYSNIHLYHIVHILLIHTILYKVGLTLNT